MPVPRITTGFLEAVPPQGPHSITFNVPNWNSCMRFKDGDPVIFQQLKCVYPRFGPFGVVKAFAGAIHQKLALPPTHGLLFWVSPDSLRLARDWATSPKRKELVLSPDDLAFHVVDIAGVRFYIVVFPAAKAKGVTGTWQNFGLGPSTRLAQELLPHVGSMSEVAFNGDVDNPPEATYLPEGPGHSAVRERITELMHRGAIEPDKVQVEAKDVFLYPSGMAAIYRAHQMLQRRREGKVLVLGGVFHNTWQIFAESETGFKHFGQVSGGDEIMDGVEAWFEEETKAGGNVSYVFVEFPSNPLLVGLDLRRLRTLATKYDAALAIDDTVGSFANIDLSPVADVVITSTTKSFSGYADVMGGSSVLIPSSPYYASLSAIFAEHHRNEVSLYDTAHLLANSADYLSRTATLNSNAAAVVSYLAAQAADPASPVTGVLYPTQNAHTKRNVDAFLRRPSEGFTPGYGCLLSVDLASYEAAVAFHDALQFHGGPHLGAHRSLRVPFNAMVFKDPTDVVYHAAYGMRAEQIRISVGLEDEAELVEAVREAVEAAVKVSGEPNGAAKEAT